MSPERAVDWEERLHRPEPWVHGAGVLLLLCLLPALWLWRSPGPLGGPAPFPGVLVRGLLQSAEKDCLQYLLTGSLPALEAFRNSNRRLAEIMEEASAQEKYWGGYEPSLPTLRKELGLDLDRWREEYALKAIGYRLSHRLANLDQFLRQGGGLALGRRLQDSLDALIQAQDRALSSREAGGRRKRNFLLACLTAGLLAAQAALSLAAWFARRRGQAQFLGLKRGETISRFSQGMQAAENEEELAGALAQAFVEDFPARSASVLLVGDDGVAVTLAARRPAASGTPTWAPMMDDKSLCPVFSTGQPYRVADVALPGARTCSCPVGVPGSGGYACQPLLVQGRLAGLANIQHPEGTSPDKEDLREAETLARLAAVGLAALRQEKNFRQVSITDGLTGVFNRRFMEASLSHQVKIAIQHSRPMGLLLMDLDFFKRINEQSGRQVGDQLLQAVAATVQETVRGGDIVSRYGGDEFVIVLPNTHFLDAREIAEKIRGKAFQAGHSASIGLSSLPEDGATEQELLLAADQALSEAKRLGRNKVVCFQEIWPGISASGAGGVRADSAAKA